MTKERQSMGGEGRAPEGARHCGNCPGRRENLRSSVCDIYGAIKWGSFPGCTTDMMRPDECKRKPKNKCEVWKRRAEQRIAEQDATQRTGEG